MSIAKKIVTLAVSGAIAGLSSIGGGVLFGRSFPEISPPALRQAAPRKRHSTGSATVSAFGYQRGPGWTTAHVKRMAKKRRNQQRNRKACRKGGAA